MNWILTKAHNPPLELDEDLRWLDEFDWSPLAQTTPVYTLGGALLIEQGEKLAGRPITLGGSWVWLRRKTLKTLQEWSAIPELEMSLKAPDGRTFQVIFSRPALSGIEPVAFHSLEDDDSYYLAPEIHFLTV